MTESKKIRLSGPQLKLLRELPRRTASEYKPIRALVMLGLAFEVDEVTRLPCNPNYKRTPAGDAYLAEKDKK
jgi:hypothetical protein